MYKNFLLLIFMVLGMSLGLAQEEDSSDTRGMMLNPELSIPPEPGPLLTSRQLDRQKIYTSLDRALVDPESVYKLDLSGQRYREVPAEIFRLVNLQVLDLGENKLSALPDNIIDLQNLQVLILTDNKLRSLPEEMREMNNLERLYLGENKLMEMPAWVGGLAKLRYMDLHRNYITLYEVNKLQERLPHCEIAY